MKQLLDIIWKKQHCFAIKVIENTAFIRYNEKEVNDDEMRILRCSDC